MFTKKGREAWREARKRKEKNHIKGGREEGEKKGGREELFLLTMRYGTSAVHRK